MRLSTRFLAVALLTAGPAAAQSLADRVGAVRDGAVLFSFAARPEVCGDGERGFRIGGPSRGWSGSGDQRPCEPGPVQVRLTLRDGSVDRVESWVGPLRARDGRALGSVPAPEAARYLLGVAQRFNGRPGARAITAAVLADSAVVWPTLLALARDVSGRSQSVRAEAALWLSRFAGAALGGHPTSLAEDEGDERDDVKRHAVFVLSQLPNKEGIPPLLEIAQSKAALAVRQQALFWLGQSGDPRALSLFEQLLRS